MISAMVKGGLFGKTEENMKAVGFLESNQEKVFTKIIMGLQRKEFGKMAEEQNGWNDFL